MIPAGHEGVWNSLRKQKVPQLAESRIIPRETCDVPHLKNAMCVCIPRDCDLGYSLRAESEAATYS
eukprot:COSAG02_NODE_3280_length_7026_cov_3.334200_4_plen_66_part_00